MFRMQEYFNRMGMSMDDVQVISEKITSHTDFTQRKLYPILENAKEGDIIYVCQLDRLGRTMVDILELVDYAVRKGVILMTIDNGYQLENKTAMGKLYLGMVSAMAEAERELRAERCQAGVDSAMADLRSNGSRTTRRGTKQTHWGNKKGTAATKRIMRIARDAAAKKATDDKMAWRESSVAYRWVMDKVASGMERKQIIGEFNRLNKLQPEVFCTRGGKPLSHGVLSKWISEANPLALA